MKMAQLIVYSVLCFLPLTTFALYTFRKMLRYSIPVTIGLAAVLMVLQILTDACSLLIPTDLAGLLVLFSTALYFGFFTLTVEAARGKTMFVVVMLSNIIKYLVMLSKCLEGLIFPELAVLEYRWSFSLMILCVYLVLLPPLFFYMKRVISPALDFTRADSIWRFIWVIPTIFFFIWYYWLHSGVNRSSLEISMRPANAIALFFVNSGALIIYYVVAMLIVEFDRNRQFQEEYHQLSIREMQYKALQERILETRHARHDLRHHITLMSKYVQNGEYDLLKDYLCAYEQSIPNIESIVFCENGAVNTLLSYFATKAKEREIHFSVNANVPKELWIAETDLSVILGNLLENALDGSAPYENPCVIVRLDAQPMRLLIAVDNTFHGSFALSEDGTYSSTKHSGEGLGLSSVQNIVQKYGGTLKIEAKDGYFYVSALLYQQGLLS